MNDNDLRNLRNLLLGAQKHLGNLNTFEVIYNAGKVTFADRDMPLSTAQKNGIKTAFTTLADKIDARVGNLLTPTGLTGTVDQTILMHIQEAPARTAGYLNQYLEGIEELLKLPPSEQPDGTWRLDFPQEIAQEYADKMATLIEGIKFYVGTERLKVN